MNKAYIKSSIIEDNFNGEGMYYLLYNNETIAKHYCSNRDFANHDLTVWRLEELDKNNIDVVYSGEKIVWSKNDQSINEETNECFNITNKKYELENR